MAVMCYCTDKHRLPSPCEMQHNVCQMFSPWAEGNVHFSLAAGRNAHPMPCCAQLRAVTGSRLQTASGSASAWQGGLLLV